MTLHLSRRTVLISLGSAALTPNASSALPSPSLAGAWHAACFATEQAWIDEAAAIERIIAQGVDNPHDRYHIAALDHWRLAETNAVKRSETFRQHVKERYPARLAQTDATLKAELAHMRKTVAGYEAREAHWKALAAKEDLAGHKARIAGAERAEDMLASTILGRSVERESERALQAQVTNRVATTPPLEKTAYYRLANVVGEKQQGASVSGRLTAAIIVRRLEALGYALPLGSYIDPYDWQTQPETDEMRRRCGRLIACARSVPNIVAAAVHFRRVLLFPEADWGLAPQRYYEIA